MPDIYTVASQYRAALLRQERAAATELVKAYAEVWQTLKRRIASLADEIAQARQAGQMVNQSWLLQFNRLSSLQRQIETELRRFIAFADPLIAGQQRAAIGLAQSHAEQLLLFNYQNAPADATAAVTGLFNRLPVAATQSLIGFAGNGSPLRVLLDALGEDASARVRSTLIEAVALGYGPKRIVSDVRDALGGNLSRALTIARTETIRAYREATHLGYEANRDILTGWVWAAKLDATTCLLCLAMHGSEHKADGRLESHPNCRCVMVPKTRSWAELGFEGIADTSPQIETGEAWFARQDHATQKKILGLEAYRAFRAGHLQLADFIGRKRQSEWGRPYYRRSLSEIASVIKTKKTAA